MRHESAIVVTIDGTGKGTVMVRTPMPVSFLEIRILNPDTGVTREPRVIPLSHPGGTTSLSVPIDVSNANESLEEDALITLYADAERTRPLGQPTRLFYRHLGPVVYATGARTLDPIALSAPERERLSAGLSVPNRQLLAVLLGGQNPSLSQANPLLATLPNGISSPVPLSLASHLSGFAEEEPDGAFGAEIPSEEASRIVSALLLSGGNPEEMWQAVRTQANIARAEAALPDDIFPEGAFPSIRAALEASFEQRRDEARIWGDVSDTLSPYLDLSAQPRDEMRLETDRQDALSVADRREAALAVDLARQAIVSGGAKAASGETLLAGARTALDHPRETVSPFPELRLLGVSGNRIALEAFGTVGHAVEVRVLHLVLINTRDREWREWDRMPVAFDGSSPSALFGLYLNGTLRSSAVRVQLVVDGNPVESETIPLSWNSEQRHRLRHTRELPPPGLPLGRIRTCRAQHRAARPAAIVARSARGTIRPCSRQAGAGLRSRPAAGHGGPRQRRRLHARRHRNRHPSAADLRPALFGEPGTSLFSAAPSYAAAHGTSLERRPSDHLRPLQR